MNLKEIVLRPIDERKFRLVWDKWMTHRKWEIVGSCRNFAIIENPLVYSSGEELVNAFCRTAFADEICLVHGSEDKEKFYARDIIRSADKENIMEKVDVLKPERPNQRQIEIYLKKNNISATKDFRIRLDFVRIGRNFLSSHLNIPFEYAQLFTRLYEERTATLRSTKALLDPVYLPLSH